MTLSDLKTLLSFQFVFCETWQFNSRHLRIKDEILSYPFLFLASSIFFAVSTLKYLTLAFCHSLDCCCCLQSDDGSEGHRGQTPPKKEFGQTSSPYFNLTGWSLYVRVFLEHWNSQKSLCNIQQSFSCPLDEWIGKICTMFFFNPFYLMDRARNYFWHMITTIEAFHLLSVILDSPLERPQI